MNSVKFILNESFFDSLKEIAFIVNTQNMIVYGNASFNNFYRFPKPFSEPIPLSKISPTHDLWRAINNNESKEGPTKFLREVHLFNSSIKLESLIHQVVSDENQTFYLIMENLAEPGIPEPEAEQKIQTPSIDLQISESIANASTELISPSLSIDTIVRIIFKACKNLTRCESGFIAYDDPQSERILLHFSDEDSKHPSKLMKNILFISKDDFETKGVYGLPINTKSAVYESDFRFKPYLKLGDSTPFVIYNYFTVPSIVKNLFMGQIVLVNAPNGFSERVQQAIKSLSNIYGLAVFRKRLEWDLIAAKEKAEESDRLKSAFLANMSHEIRTPMNSIIGFSQLLTSGALPDERKKDFFGMINNSCHDLLSIVTNIIDMSRIEAGLLKMKLEPANLNDLLHYIYNITQLNLSDRNKNIALELDIPSDENLEIVIDKVRFKQIFTNLLSNAVKFTNKGTIKFGYQSLGNGWLRFYVSDTGIGIAATEQKKIFENFRQIETTVTRNYGGTGLGLAISKNLVEHMGGTMGLTSKVGQGSEFWFDLPLTDNPALDWHSNDYDIHVPLLNLKEKRILIVEDDDKSSKVLEFLLKSTQAKITIVQTGIEAIDAVKHQNIDLILMDIRLPVMDGYEATRRIKEFSNIPIIAQTAYALKTDIQKCKQAGCDGYIAKPVKKAALFQLIESVLFRP